MKGSVEQVDRSRLRALGALVAAPWVWRSGAARAQDGKLTPPVRLRVEGMLPSLAGATGWLNSTPLDPDGLRGKVVLIDVWTYTCINWIRTLPHVRGWARKYRDDGLVVIGVHSPEFEFEKKVDNIRQAAQAMSVSHPIAIDSNFAIWRALQNRAWPALYFVDVQGRIRHHHFGEGQYGQSERIIQYLLSESGSNGIDLDLLAANGVGVEAAPDWRNLRSPENYTGYLRTANFASNGGAVRDKPRMYAAPARLMLNHWALAGDWTVKEDRAVLNAAGGRISCGFHARDLHLVMGPAMSGSSVGFRVRIDGQPPGAAHGVDTDEQGHGQVSQQRLYQLVRQPGRIETRQFEIEFAGPGVEAYAFTFG